MRRSTLVALLLALTACAPEGPTAFVSHNIPPDSACVVEPRSSGLFLPTGKFDIARGANDECEKPYMLNLLVNSNLRTNQNRDLGRSEPNVLQIHSAEVRLMDLDKRTIIFEQSDPMLPNPFLVTTNNSIYPSLGTAPSLGIAAVEAIPIAYADQLDSFVGGQILAEIQIFGTTTGDVDVDLKPFVYPIEICDGCLTTCLGRLVFEDVMVEDLIGDDCDDNAGADGRWCITSSQQPDCR